jgi:hypothetical protein
LLSISLSYICNQPNAPSTSPPHHSEQNQHPLSAFQHYPHHLINIRQVPPTAPAPAPLASPEPVWIHQAQASLADTTASFTTTAHHHQHKYYFHHHQSTNEPRTDSIELTIFAVAAGSSTRSSMKWEINDEIGFIISDKVDMNYLSKIRSTISSNHIQ